MMDGHDAGHSDDDHHDHSDHADGGGSRGGGGDSNDGGGGSHASGGEGVTGSAVGSHASHSSALAVELREHVPFSVSAVAIGLTMAGLICLLGFVGSDGGASGGVAGVAAEAHRSRAAQPALMFFHLFHPVHMLFSATATTAMFCRYENRVGKAVVIGLIGSIGVCGVSDIVMPQLSLILLGSAGPWHVCVYEDPSLVLPFAAAGVLVGILAAGGVMRSTIISHSLHVFASTMASVFYMIGPLGILAWIDDLGMVFLFVVVAVVVPCCVSDIVFPLLMSHGGRERLTQDPHTH